MSTLSISDLSFLEDLDDQEVKNYGAGGFAGTAIHSSHFARGKFKYYRDYYLGKYDKYRDYDYHSSYFGKFKASLDASISIDDGFAADYSVSYAELSS